MLKTLLSDLESALSGVRESDLSPRSATRPSSAALDDAASFSAWLPYRAYLEDEQVFVNRDSLAFCLELRPQSGADEEMTRILTSLFAAFPPGTGLQFHLFASPNIRRRLAAYAGTRRPDDEVPELATLLRVLAESTSERCRFRQISGRRGFSARGTPVYPKVHT